MNESLPIVIIVIAGILIVIALMTLRTWTKQREGKLKQPVIKNKKAFFIQWIVGLMLSLTAAFFMFDGDILGDYTIGIATVVGIVGICLIATSNITLLCFKRRE